MLHMKAESSCQIQHGLQKYSTDIWFTHMTPPIFSFQSIWLVTVLEIKTWFHQLSKCYLVWMIGIESPLWIVWPLASHLWCFCFFEIKEMCNPPLGFLVLTCLGFFFLLCFAKLSHWKLSHFTIMQTWSIIIKKRNLLILCKVSEILVITSHYRSLIWDNFDLFF